MSKYELRQSLFRAPLAAALGSALAGGTAQAATITVNTTDDAPVGTLPGVCTLRSAVHAANAAAAGVDGCDPGSADADEIEFAPGLANSTITLSEGEMKITGPLTITGPTAGRADGITLDGAGASRIFRMAGGEPGDFEVALRGMALANGRAVRNGGAVYASNVDLVLDHVQVVDNRSVLGGGGGGLCVHDGDVTVGNSTISNNSAAADPYSYDDRYGGGLSVLRGDVTVSNSTISDNSVMAAALGGSSYGGGLTVRNGSTVLINSTISSNSAAHGGGMSILGGSLTLIQTTVADNTVPGNYDSILSLASSLTLNNSLIVQAGGDRTACNQATDDHSNTLVTDDSCTGTATSPASIALNPLADNGGPAQTHALNGGSAAIDAAGHCRTDFGIDQDQRGAPRPVDGDGDGTAACDIGAYERQNGLFRDRFEGP